MRDDVTLISPCTHTRRMPPLGILYVASYLEMNDISVKVIDGFPPRKITDWRDYETDSPYVGITCMSSQWNRAKEIAQFVKMHNPNATVVVGGVHPTVAADAVSKEKNVDIVVVGFGEKAMLKIVKNGVRDGIIYGDSFANLDDRPFPARHLVDMKKYTARDSIVHFHWLRATSVITSLGCANACIYCSNSKRAIFGKVVQYNSSDYVEHEIEQLVSNYKIEGVYFQDDNFLSWKKRAIHICKKIERFDLTWMCESRVDTLDEEMLKCMKSAGCDGVGFGVESGSPKVLQGLNKRADIGQTIKAFDLCKKYKMKTLAQMIIGSPDETQEDIALTEKLLDRIKPDYVQFSFLTPYEGTVLYDMAVEKGWLRADANMITDDPQIEINFSLEELAEIGKRLKRKYNPFFKSVKPYLNGYFIYDMLKLLWKEPSLITRGMHEWMEASRLHL